MKLHRSKWHQRQHLIRALRRAALNQIAADNASAGTPPPYTARFNSLYGRYCRIAFPACGSSLALMFPSPTVTPLARQCVRVRSYLAMRAMGWRDVRA